MSHYPCRKELKRFNDQATIRSVLRQHDQGRFPRRIAFIENLPLLVVLRIISDNRNGKAK